MSQTGKVAFDTLAAEVLRLRPSDRAAYIERVGQSHPELKDQLASLLAAIHAEETRERPSSSADSDGQPPAPATGTGLTAALSDAWRSGVLQEGPGANIGRYKLLQRIGEGGFGVVFMAEQREPVQRKVALKIIKLGMDTRQVIARFEAERQALAMMDHPHIARVLDAGATETGRPYFVMELCTGIPITKYADAHKLSIPERLTLFIQVCHAVQHAHQKAIIHRDIKPSNVLVHTQDGQPHAKVIDFGVSKATAAPLTERTLFTEHRQMIGTPAYMSPEQAEGSQDVDTRSDIYSLGVLLYELLTGSTPFDPKSMRGATQLEIVRMIREVDPPRPSTRLHDSGGTLPTIAASRQIEPRKLGPLLRGELDWIVMKALDKDRARRYETANGLAMDVRRYLAREPVVAGPPTAAYQVKRLLLRYRKTLASVSALILVLALGLVGTTYWWQRARHEKEVAVRAREHAEQAQRHAQDALNRLAAQTQRDREVSQFLQSLMLIAAPKPGSDEFENTEGMLAQAQRLFGDEHAIHDAMAAAWTQLLLVSGQPRRAEAVASALYERVRQRPPGDPLRASLACLLAQAMKDQERLEEASGLLRKEWTESAALGSPTYARLRMLDTLVSVLTELQRDRENPELARLWPALVEDATAVRGRDADWTMERKCAYGCWLERYDQPAAAVRVLQPLIPQLRERRLLNREWAMRAVDSLILALVRCERKAEAKPLYRALLDLYRERQGAASRVYEENFREYTGWLRIHGENDLADEEQRRFELERQRAPAIGSRSDAETYHHARLELFDGQAAEALGVLAPLQQKLSTTLAPDHPHRLAVDWLYALCLREAGQADEAETALRAYIDRVQTDLGPGHGLALRARVALALVPEKRGRIDEAHQALSALWNEISERHGGKRSVRQYFAFVARGFCERHKLSEELKKWTLLAGEGSVLPGPTNLGFEDGDLLDVPDGWFPTPAGRNIANIQGLTDVGAYEGSKCVVLSTLEGAARISCYGPQGGPSGRGVGQNCRDLIQQFNGAPYQGQRIRFSAAVRVESGPSGSRDDRAVLWLNAFRPNGQEGLYRESREIRNPAWERYELTGAVHADADRIQIGIMALGEATVWVDDVRLEIIDESGNARPDAGP